MSLGRTERNAQDNTRSFSSNAPAQGGAQAVNVKIGLSPIKCVVASYLFTLLPCSNESTIAKYLRLLFQAKEHVICRGSDGCVVAATEDGCGIRDLRPLDGRQQTGGRFQGKCYGGNGP